MDGKREVRQGTLALMVLKTLETLGPLHGYGIARRIEQTSGDRLLVNYGTLYPALLKLEQEGFIASEWGTSENNRRAKYYRLTRAGRRQVGREARDWARAASILGCFLTPGEECRSGRCVPGWRGWPACSGASVAIGRSPRSSRVICRCRQRRASASA